MQNQKTRKLSSLLLTRCSEKYVADIGYDLWTGNYKAKTQKIPTETYLTVYNDCKLGSQTYTKQKIILVSKHFYLGTLFEQNKQN